MGVVPGRLLEDFWERLNLCIEVPLLANRTLCLNAKAGFVLQATFVLLSVFFFSNTFLAMKDWHQFIDLQIHLYHVNKCVLKSR